MSSEEWIQSGVVPYRFRKDRMQVLVISTGSGSKYIFPKGYIGGRLSPQKSALREAYEEAGVKGKILGPCVGCYHYRRGDERFRVDMYPMRVTRVLSRKDWPEADLRSREWMSAAEASEILHYRPLADVVLMMDRFAMG